MLSELSGKGFAAPEGRLLKVIKNGFEQKRMCHKGRYQCGMLQIRFIQAAGPG